MELKGTTASIKDMEELLIKQFPCKLVHDGSRPFQTSEGEHQSLAYSKLYHLFPRGVPGQIVLDEFWRRPVKVRFAYDGRFGDGSMRVSKEGMRMLGSNLAEVLSRLDLYQVQGTDNGNGQES